MKFDEMARKGFEVAREGWGKVAAGGTAMLASGMAMAQSTTPGAAIAGELSGGKDDVMLIIGAVAVILGALIVWGYVKRAR